MDEQKLLMIMTSGANTPTRCAAPFAMATVAAVMDSEVAMVFNMDGISLLKKGVAENVYALEGGMSALEFLRQAKEAGVSIYACAPALDLYHMTKADLIDEVDEVVGGAWVIEEGYESDMVLTF
ncbi:MAG: sulfur reduction protein DsrE [Alphaproteobacteria bacterium CG_4_10_14_0_2_um_filter_63_37]|nr:MAG: sulfur reduction protein DsrE [Proteobacteria bacterium CG1_02_64_396]PJA24070.1 MAG: sulfur reduction protein DsrE [Alphaproteobacteria bacterium CG_4_10_14_0_2_um_filter_63_37]